MYQLSKEESDRIKIIKVIAMVMVVYIHSYATDVNFKGGTVEFELPVWLYFFEETVSQVVSRCAVPTFFLISSVLLFKAERGYIDTIKKKTKTILLPYVIWNTLWVLIFIALEALPFTAAYFSGSNTPILRSSWQEWLGLYGIGEDYPKNYPLWFMRDLMVAFLFFPIIKYFAVRSPKAAMAVGVIMALAPIGFPFMALPWFVIGAALVELKIHLTALDNIAMWKMTAVYIPCAAITLYIGIAGDENIAHITGRIFILLGIMFWTRASKKIYNIDKLKTKFLTFSEWTFIVFAFHGLAISSVKKVCFRLLPTTPFFLFAEYAILPVFIIICCIIFGKMFKHLCPKLYAISTGER